MHCPNQLKLELQLMIFLNRLHRVTDFSTRDAERGGFATAQSRHVGRAV